MRPHQQGHLVDAAMAAFASNAAVDMDRVIEENIIGQLRHPVPDQRLAAGEALPHLRQHRRAGRSEARRVGKECVSTCRSRWSPYPETKNKRPLNTKQNKKIEQQ